MSDTVYFFDLIWEVAIIKKNKFMVNITQEKAIKNVYPLLGVKERLLIWEKAKGIWKNRKPNPEIEMRKIRKEWERKIN